MEHNSILPLTWQVPDEIRNRLGKKVGRQRAMFAEGHLVLVLHAPPKPDEDERRPRFIWRSPDGAWRSSEGGQGPGVVYRHLDEFTDVIQHYDEQEDRASKATEYFALLDALGPVHRAARNCYQVFQDARQLRPDDREIINFRDRAYENERRAELLYQGAKNSLEFSIAKRVEEQAEVSHRMSVAAHRLNVMAAFFFPIATLSAIFGVNMVHGLERAHAPYSFLALVAAGLAGGILLTRYITR
jgi:hypothetical protein